MSMLHSFSKSMFAGVVSLVLGCGMAMAQEQTPAPGKSSDQKESQSADRSADQNTSVTGCLQADTAGKDTYRIAGEDGKTYTLKSSSNSVKLGDHLNHKVTVTGKSSGGELNITDLKMVSPSCQ